MGKQIGEYKLKLALGIKSEHPGPRSGTEI
jgi:hypothetical protein